MAAIAPAAGRARGDARSSLKRERRRALYWSYFFLVLFAVFFLTPPIYMLITSLKSSAEIGAHATNPWWVYNPTLENYKALLTSAEYLTFFRNSAIVSLVVVVDHHADQHPGRVRAGAHEVLGLGDARHRRVPHLPDPRDAALHPALQDLRLGERRPASRS